MGIEWLMALDSGFRLFKGFRFSVFVLVLHYFGSFCVSVHHCGFEYVSPDKWTRYLRYPNLVAKRRICVGQYLDLDALSIKSSDALGSERRFKGDGRRR